MRTKSQKEATFSKAACVADVQKDKYFVICETYTDAQLLLSYF